MEEELLCTAIPIHDAQLNVVAHELLLGHHSAREADFGDMGPATCDLLLNAFAGVTYGLDPGQQPPILVPVTRNLLCSN